VPASEVSLIKREYEGKLRSLQAQADKPLELAKAKGAESTLWLEFDQRLTKDKEILAAKYDTEVDELRTSQGVEIEKHDAEIQTLADL
jgi:hypothetical protein